MTRLSRNSVVVAVLRRAPDMKGRLSRAAGNAGATRGLGETEYGVKLATPAERQREAVKTFLESAALLLPTACTAVEYGRIKAALKMAGTPLPENDVWIAAFAVERGLALATRDAHFAPVLGWTLLDWR